MASTANPHFEPWYASVLVFQRLDLAMIIIRRSEI
jgi:hypothetical protein